MSKIDRKNTGSQGNETAEDEQQMLMTRRNCLRVIGGLFVAAEAIAIIKKLANITSTEKSETFMGVQLKIVTPKHKPDELPELQQSLMKKSGAEYDKNTGNVLYGSPAKYMIDEPVVEFEHTLVEGYGKNSKTSKGKLQLKISVAKALIQAEKELGEPIPVREGIRSNQTQKIWYDRNNCLGNFDKSGCSTRPYPTAPPGLSEHEKGQAIDIDTRQRLKYKKVLIKYGFLDDTRKDLPHFTFKAIPFTSEDQEISKWNDTYAESPEWKKWIMREGSWIDKQYRKMTKGLPSLSGLFKRR